MVDIGGVPIALRCDDPTFGRMVQERYEGFVLSPDAESVAAQIGFDIELLVDPVHALRHDDASERENDDLEVTLEGGRWWMRRGDFLAEWDPSTGQGRIRQALNPYSLDSVLRIVHSLVLARQGEFLVHAASAIRNGQSFLFAGVSGAGKTTISRLAPADAILLTDEISYVRKGALGYVAHGTPFAGELARVGEHCSAPLNTLFLLRQGRENRIDDVDPALATQALLRNILFFAQGAELVQCVFEGACEFVQRVPVRQLTFRKDASVWELVG